MNYINQKVGLVLAVWVFCFSCGERTEYPPGFSGEEFKKIAVGDRFEHVIEKLGPPFECIAYKGPPNKLNYERIRVDEVVERSMDPEVSMVRLHYSLQVDSVVDYMHCEIVIKKAKVADKTWHLITE